MDTGGRLIAGSHNRNEFVLINADENARIKSVKELSGQTCQICGDEIEITVDGEPFVACNECAFPVCRPCYEYERREGNQACPQCKTRYKRIKGSPRVEGDEEEDDIDDLEHEFDYLDDLGPQQVTMILRLKKPNKILTLLRHFTHSQPHRSTPSSSYGQLYSTSELLSFDQRQRQRGGRRRTRQVWLSCGSSLSLSRLLDSSSHCTHYSSHCQIPSLLPHSSSLCSLQKILLIKAKSVFISSLNQSLPAKILNLNYVNYRKFSSVRCDNSGSDADVESHNSSETEIDNVSVKSSADSQDVERVCKVINELFALDRNMEAVLDECGVNLSHDLVLDVLEQFRHARKPAFRFFCWAGGKPGFTHDSRTYNSMLSILGKTRQFESMVSMLEEMGEKKLLTMDTFKIAMNAFAAAKERKKAVAIFELMKKHKYKVGVDTINYLLDDLGKEKLGKEAQVLFDKLKERFTPNLRTYTVLLNGWCRMKNLMEAGRVWNEMIDLGFKPDIVAHNTMLEGLFKCKKRSDAIKLFEVMKAKGPLPNVRSYTIIIRYLCKQGMMGDAMEYFHVMLESGCEPDAAVYTCLITGFGNRKRMDLAFDLLKEMQEKGCPPDGRTYNALIKLLTSQRMPDDAVTVYKKMIKSGIEPTIHTYNMIMKSYFQVRNHEMGHAVWEEMIKKGCCPDDNSYTVFIGGLISQGRSGEACKYLEEMIEKGMKTPQLDYNKFAADFSRAGKPDILEELARKMKFSGKFEVSDVFARWAEMMKKRVKRRDPIKLSEATSDVVAEDRSTFKMTR